MQKEGKKKGRKEARLKKLIFIFLWRTAKFQLPQILLLQRKIEGVRKRFSRWPPRPHPGSSIKLWAALNCEQTLIGHWPGSSEQIGPDPTKQELCEGWSLRMHWSSRQPSWIGDGRISVIISSLPIARPWLWPSWPRVILLVGPNRDHSRDYGQNRQLWAPKADCGSRKLGGSDQSCIRPRQPAFRRRKKNRPT